MLKRVFVCLIVALGLWACDDGGGGTCVDLAEDPSFVFDLDPDCPTDALKQVCNRYSCINEQSPNLNGTVRPQACRRQDCFLMTCSRVIQDGSAFRGLFSVDEVFEDSSFIGRLTVRDVVFDAVCSPILDQ